MRIIGPNIRRGASVTIDVDGQPVAAFLGETVATAMLAARGPVFRQDTRGSPRGLYCNMGTCSECFVWITLPEGKAVRLRACLTSVVPGMQVCTDPGASHERDAHE
jgi:sarcosine oxidase subunit alpha